MPTDIVPFLGEARKVEDNHPILLAQLLADLLGQDREQGLMIPWHVPDELLDSLSFLIVEISDLPRLLCSSFDSRPVNLFVACRCCSGSLRVAANGSMKMSNRSSRRIDQVRRHLRLCQHVSQPCFVSSIHDALASL